MARWPDGQMATRQMAKNRGAAAAKGFFYPPLREAKKNGRPYFVFHDPCGSSLFVSMYISLAFSLRRFA